MDQIGQIAKDTGNDWQENKLSSKFYMGQNVKIGLFHEKTVSV
jgi:hypothetical protein